MAGYREILNTNIKEIEKMERAKLAVEVSKAASAANKRIKRLQKAGLNTSALRYTMEHGGKFSVAGKTKDELIEELKRVKGFLGAKTSSVSGAKKSAKETMDIISTKEYEAKKREAKLKGEDFEVKLDKEGKEIIPKRELSQNEINKFWETVDLLRKQQTISFENQCLLYTEKIRTYVERGRSVKQSASYIRASMKTMQKQAMEEVSKLDKEIAYYQGNGYGNNEYGGNNL